MKIFEIILSLWHSGDLKKRPSILFKVMRISPELISEDKLPSIRRPQCLPKGEQAEGENYQVLSGMKTLKPPLRKRRLSGLLLAEDEYQVFYRKNTRSFMGRKIPSGLFCEEEEHLAFYEQATRSYVRRRRAPEFLGDEEDHQDFFGKRR